MNAQPHHAGQEEIVALNNSPTQKKLKRAVFLRVVALQLKLPFPNALPEEIVNIPQRSNKHNELSKKQPAEVISYPFGNDEPGERTALSRYLGQIRQYARLTPEEEIATAFAARQGDDEAQARLITANLRLAVYFALRYRDYGRPIQDLIADGNIGLIEAAKRFDPSLGHRFSTYAERRITNAIKDGLQKNCRNIELPKHIYIKLCKIVKTYNQYRKTENREPDISEIAVITGLSETEIKYVLRLPYTISTTFLSEEEADIITHTIEALPAPDCNSYDTDDRSQLLHKALSTLTERERHILTRRFGLNDNNEEASYNAIAKELNSSYRSVSKAERRALIKLKEYICQYTEGKCI